MSSYDNIKPGLGLGKNGHTQAKQSDGSKQIKCDRHFDMKTAADIGKDGGNKSAPAVRLYDRDYSKVRREPGDTDLVTAALGNPLIW